MARICTICSHKKCKQIEAAIAARESNRGIARTFRVSEDALQRHHEQHMQPIMEQVIQEQQEATKQTLLSALERVKRDTGLIDEALQEVWKENSKDVELLIYVLRESRHQNRLYAALTGELRQQNITDSPAWQEAIGLLFEALQAYPEAHQAVITHIEAERAKRRRA